MANCAVRHIGFRNRCACKNRRGNKNRRGKYRFPISGVNTDIFNSILNADISLIEIQIYVFNLEIQISHLNTDIRISIKDTCILNADIQNQLNKRYL